MLQVIRRNTFGQFFLRNIVSIVTLIALTCCIYTYAIIAQESAPLGIKPVRVVRWLTIDFALLVLLLAIIARRIFSVWDKLRSGSSAGSKLQKRILWLFTIVTITPTVVVSIFAALFFNLGIQAWFNERVQTALNESLAVAEAYLAEHKENIRADARAMARDLGQVSPLAISDPVEFKNIISAQAALRELTESALFIGNRLVVEGRLSFALAFEHIPEELFERAQNGEVVIMTTEFDKVRALVKIDGIRGGVLLVGRLIDPKVLGHMSKTQGAVNEYNMLRQHLLALEVNFELVFLVLIILLLMASVWYGLVFAARLTNPISSLVNAAERVRSGDYSARVVAVRKDEIGTLSRTFNRMTEQLEAQREELILANRSLDERRRFSEAVLAGVSAGVIALNPARKITIYSRSALAIMGTIGQVISEDVAIGELLPGIDDMLNEAVDTGVEGAQQTITITSENKILTLHVRITVERFGEEIEGFIVTFDDISPLIAAQRNAAWADVARRVAHEIKNPLTPIQLSAERLKRKYSKFITEEPENYHKYIDTITRHVADIGKMVEEFVSFARMPTPRFQELDIAALARNALFSAQVANPTIAYENQIGDAALPITADEGQISQVLTNILKNAAESIEAKAQIAEEAGINDYQGFIRIVAQTEAELVVLRIEDNGKGFPEDGMDKMFEPYVTTRSKGTGLGLSIVKKIMDDHKALIKIENIDGGGARVMLSFLPHCDINAARATKDE